jgi:hypothetical protein
MYEVQIQVQQTHADQWLSWMLEKHIPDVMQTGTFLSCELCRITQPAIQGIVLFRITYTAISEQALQDYRAHISPALQKEHNELFGDYTRGERRELIVEKIFSKN